MPDYPAHLFARSLRNNQGSCSSILDSFTTVVLQVVGHSAERSSLQGAYVSQRGNTSQEPVCCSCFLRMLCLQGVADPEVEDGWW